MGTGICWGNLTNCGEVTCDGRPGGVEILLATSCYGNRDKRRQYEPVWLIRLHFIIISTFVSNFKGGLIADFKVNAISKT